MRVLSVMSSSIEVKTRFSFFNKIKLFTRVMSKESFHRANQRQKKITRT